MSFEAILPPFNAGDPTANFLNSSCLDFLLIELVPMAYRVTNELEADARARSLAVAAAEAGLEGAAGVSGGAPTAGASSAGTATDKMGSVSVSATAAGTGGGGGAAPKSAGLGPPGGGGGAAAGAGAGAAAGAGRPTAGGFGAANGRRLLDEDEERDAVFFRLEMLGYRVGQGLVER